MTDLFKDTCKDDGTKHQSMEHSFVDHDGYHLLDNLTVSLLVLIHSPIVDIPVSPDCGHVGVLHAVHDHGHHRFAVPPEVFRADLLDDDVGDNVKEENDPEPNKVMSQCEGSVQCVGRRNGVGWIGVVPPIHVTPGDIGLVKVENICGCKVPVPLTIRDLLELPRIEDTEQSKTRSKIENQHKDSGAC